MYEYMERLSFTIRFVSLVVAAAAATDIWSIYTTYEHVQVYIDKAKISLHKPHDDKKKQGDKIIYNIYHRPVVTQSDRVKAIIYVRNRQFVITHMSSYEITCRADEKIVGARRKLIIIVTKQMHSD